jgi:hypothetical protein
MHEVIQRGTHDAYCSDWKRFDASPCEEFIAVETHHQLHLGLGSDPAAHKAMTSLHSGRGILPNGQIYANSGTVRSGESGTTIKGCKINGQVTLLVLSETLHETLDWCTQNCIIFVSGDDSVVFVPRTHRHLMHAFNTNAARYGFSAAIRHVDEDHIDFLGCWLETVTFENGAVGRLLVPMVGRQLPKIGFCVQQRGRTERECVQHTSAIMRGYMAIAAAHPLWAPIVSKYTYGRAVHWPKNQIALYAPRHCYSGVQRAAVLSRYSMNQAAYEEYTEAVRVSPLRGYWPDSTFRVLIGVDNF